MVHREETHNVVRLGLETGERSFVAAVCGLGRGVDQIRDRRGASVRGRERVDLDGVGAEAGPQVEGERGGRIVERDERGVRDVRAAHLVGEDLDHAGSREVAVVDVVCRGLRRAPGAALERDAVDIALGDRLRRPGDGHELRAGRSVVPEPELLPAEGAGLVEDETRIGAVKVDGDVDFASGRRGAQLQPRAVHGDAAVDAGLVAANAEVAGIGEDRALGGDHRRPDFVGRGRVLAHGVDVGLGREEERAVRFVREARLGADAGLLGVADDEAARRDRERPVRAEAYLFVAVVLDNERVDRNVVVEREGVLVGLDVVRRLRDLVEDLRRRMSAQDERAVRRRAREVEVPPVLDGTDDPRDDRGVGVEDVRHARVGRRVGRRARSADRVVREVLEHEEVAGEGLVVRIPEAGGSDMDDAVAGVLERGEVQHVCRTVRARAVEELDGEEAVAHDKRFRAVRNGDWRGTPARVVHAGDARHAAVEDPLLRGEGVVRPAP